MTKKLFFHLEDNRVAQKLLSNIFKESADFISIQTVKQANNAIIDNPEIDCFFIDLNLDNESGMDFLKNISTMVPTPLKWPSLNSPSMTLSRPSNS